MKTSALLARGSRETPATEVAIAPTPRRNSSRFAGVALAVAGGPSAIAPADVLADGRTNAYNTNGIDIESNKERKQDKRERLEI